MRDWRLFSMIKGCFCGGFIVFKGFLLLKERWPWRTNVWLNTHHNCNSELKLYYVTTILNRGHHSNHDSKSCFSLKLQFRITFMFKIMIQNNGYVKISHFPNTFLNDVIPLKFYLNSVIFQKQFYIICKIFYKKRKDNL